MASIGDTQERRVARPTGRSLWRGFLGRCPKCGEGRILHHYLKVYDACPVCGEEFHHHRADDAPPYITILVVGHILGAAVLASEDWTTAANVPLWLQATVWPIVALGLCLVLLPRFKGALIALQWAVRMHGFEAPTAARVLGKGGG